jgi:hypothetical protein
VNASILLCSALLGGAPVQSTYVVQPVAYTQTVSQPKPTVLSNMRSRLNQLFGKQQPAPQGCQSCQQAHQVYPAGRPAMVTMEPPTVIHQASSREFVPSQYRPIPQAQAIPQSEVLVEGQEHVFQVKDHFQRKIGRADDCSWITGQLFYVHADGGKWILRYAAVDEEDKYGGSVVLAPAVNMKNFREGDLVSVTGHLLSEARASKFLGGPLYRVETIDMMDRAD